MVHTRILKGILSSVLIGALSACAVEPEPLTSKKVIKRTQSDLQQLRSTAFVPTGAISLEQAIARAIAFNMQGRVKQIEHDIADAELRTKSFEMLPSLQLDAGRARKDQSLSSTDQRITNTASIGLTWNILDLGVSKEFRPGPRRAARRLPQCAEGKIPAPRSDKIIGGNVTWCRCADH